MIIFEINIKGIAPLENESQPPIPTNGYGPSAFALAFQLMQTVSRKIHILRRGRAMQEVKLSNQPFSLS